MEDRKALEATLVVTLGVRASEASRFCADLGKSGWLAPWHRKRFMLKHGFPWVFDPEAGYSASGGKERAAVIDLPIEDALRLCDAGLIVGAKGRG